MERHRDKRGREGDRHRKRLRGKLSARGGQTDREGDSDGHRIREEAGRVVMGALGGAELSPQA